MLLVIYFASLSNILLHYCLTCISVYSDGKLILPVHFRL